MPLRLTSRDAARLAEITATLLAPAAGVERLDAWWRTAEAPIRDLFPGATVMYSVPHGERMLHLSESIDAGMRRRMGEMVGIDPSTGRTRTQDVGLAAWHRARHAARMHLWNDAINAELLAGLGTAIDRLSWYNDGLVPAGLRTFSGLTSELPTGETVLCIGYDARGRARRDAAEELALMRLLIPTVHASHHAWAMHAERQAAMQAQLDRMREALHVVGPDGRTLHRNVACDRLLAQEPERERLTATMDAMAAELRAPRGVIAVATPARTVRTALGAYALRASHAPAALWGVEGAVQLSIEPAHAAPVATPATAAVHGLTAREAEVAALLARRARDPEIASALGISVHTARHHSEKVLRKLGLRSRAHVAAALAGGRQPTTVDPQLAARSRP
ncbi:MAG: helix-turn-helix transcriptional regulator [Gemmatirosa sp.]